MEKSIMTKCAATKFKVKHGMNKKRAQKQSDRILKYGVTHKEAQGQLKGFMTYLYFRCGSNNTRLYGDTAYLFMGQVIVSHYKIPDHLIPLVKQMNKEKKERLGGVKQMRKQPVDITPLSWER